MKQITTAAAAAGAADTALFLARRPALFREAPGRARGSLGFLALWTGLAVSAARDGDRTGPVTVGLAAANAGGNLAMLAAHVRARIRSPRVFLGAALSGVALASALAGR